MWNDLKWAFRAIRRSPSLSVAAIVCTSLGIGANSAVFSVAASTLARNIRGVQEPGRLVAVHRTDRGSCCSENSYPVYDDLRRQTNVFESVEAHYPLLSVTLDDAAGPARIWGQVVSPEYFHVLKTPLILGHPFASAEPGFVVISHSLWQRRFGSDRSIIGHRVSLNRQAFTILGVAPPVFRGPDLAVGADLWVSVGSLDQVMPQHPSLQDRTAAWLVVYARLQPGVSLARAQAQLNGLANRLAREHAGSDAARGFLAEPATAFHPSYRGAVVNVAVIVAALVLLVLVVACANVANILLSRASARRKEIAIRAALGAGRFRLIREMLVESMALALLGGCAGVVLSCTLLRLAASIRLPVSLPVEFSFQTDWRVLAFAASLSLVTGLLLGILPALRASTVNLIPALKNDDSSGHSSKWAASDALVVVQVSLAVVLLIFTSLFLRSLAAASGVNPGFRADRLLLVDLDPRTSGSPATVMERLRSRLETLPGVTSATFTDVVPLGLGSRAANIRRPEDPDSALAPIRADVFQVGPRFFETLGIRLLRGRDFGAAGEPSDSAAIINSTAATHLWPGEYPVGRYLRRAGRIYRVLGVVNNIKTRTVGESERPCMFVPLPGSDRSDPIPFGLTLVIYTAGEPLQMAESVRRTIGELEPLLAISNVRTIAQHIDGALVFPRAGALVFGAFGAVAILLTSIGLYGVISYSVARRTREFGIRFAVGARYADVLRIVIVRGATVSGVGVALGLAAAYFGTRVLRTLLYGVAAHDLVSFAIVPLMVTSVSLLACYIPAHRVARIDPLVALRSD
jgi:predicted permease